MTAASRGRVLPGGQRGHIRLGRHCLDGGQDRGSTLASTQVPCVWLRQSRRKKGLGIQKQVLSHGMFCGERLRLPLRVATESHLFRADHLPGSVETPTTCWAVLGRSWKSVGGSALKPPPGKPPWAQVTAKQGEPICRARRGSQRHGGEQRQTQREADGERDPERQRESERFGQKVAERGRQMETVTQGERGGQRRGGLGKGGGAAPQPQALGPDQHKGPLPALGS